MTSIIKGIWAAALRGCQRCHLPVIAVAVFLPALDPTLASAQNATLAWDPNPETNLSNYTLHYGVASRIYTSQFDVATNRTVATVSNLAAGQTYYFAVTARNVDGLVSDPSNEVSYTVPATNNNTSPVAIAAALQASEDQATPVTLVGTDSDGNPLTYAIVTGPTNGRLSGTAPTLSYLPNTNFFGADSFTFRVNDGRTNSAPATISIAVNPVNDQPTLDTIGNLTLNEDASLQTVNLSGISPGTGNESQTLNVTVASSNPGLIASPTVNYNSPNSTGSITFAPSTNANGTATLTVTVNDGQAQNNLVTRTFNVTVNPVNDRPSLSPLSNLDLAEDAGTQSINLVGINSGAPDENQTLTVTAISSNPALIPSPTIAYTSPNNAGTIGFRSATNGTGSSTITLTVNDGQSANNTFSQSFTVTVTGVNDPPTITSIADQTINQNSATANLAFTVGDVETSAGTLTLAGASSNPALVPTSAIVFGGSGANRTVRVTPTLNQNGSAQITVTVSDANGGSANNTFLLTVNAVNQVPTLDPLTNLTLAEDAGPQTVPISGITAGAGNESQPLTVTATSSNPALIPNPTVTYTSPDSLGLLSFTPAVGASGSATLTVTVNDGQAQNNTATRSFTVTINGLNDPPTLDPIADLAFSEDAPAQTVALSGISSGATNEFQTLTVTAVSSNPSLIPNPTVSYTSPNSSGSIRFAPLTNASGTAVITVSVNDGQAQANLITRSFTITVNEINDPPTLNAIANVSIDKNDGLQTVSLSGIGSGASNENQTLAVTATSSDPTLIPSPGINYTSPSATGSLTFMPAPDLHGSATITITVNDGGSQNNTVSRDFTVTVNKVNSPPTLDPIPNLSIAEDSPTQIMSLTGISPGAGDDPQPLVITATSSDTNLFPNPTITYVSPAQTGVLSFTPALNATGTAIITITVNDGQTLNNTFARSFTVTLQGVNDPPTISDITDRTVSQNASSGPIPFRVTDPETTPGSLAVTASSSNPTLLPTNGMVFGGSGSNRTVTINPAQNENGSGIVTLTVSDAEGSVASTSFRVTVIGANVPPTMDPISNVTLGEDAPITTVALSGISAGTAGESQSITITTTSSNPSLVPPPAVDYVSPGTTGLLTFQPAANASGFATITVRIDDGQAENNAVTRSFTLTVTPLNDAPIVSSIPNQRTEPNIPTATIPFVIGDAESPVASLRLSVASSNPSLVPTANIILAGSSSNRTVQVRPAADLTGNSTVTIAVSDGALTASTVFIVTVQPGNTAPTISVISNQVMDIYHEMAPVQFVVSDAESDPESLIVTASSFNQPLLPDSEIVLAGVGAVRTITLRPLPEKTGFATIAVTVSDGRLSTRSSFMLTVDVGTPPVDQLVLETQGSGTVSPDLISQPLIVGKTYTVAASPAPGQIFAGWSGSVTSMSPNLSFRMASNLTLRARFMTNPFVARKGIFNGLFHEPDDVRQGSSGFLTLALTDRGSFSGRLILEGKALPFRGTLDFDCNAAVKVARTRTNALTMQLSFGKDGFPEHVTGQISDGMWIADLQGDRAVYNSRTNPAPFGGAYTLAIPGRAGDPLRPEGDGVGTLKVDGNGRATFAGTLADGTRVSQGVPLSRNGEWPVYIPLYTGKGSLLSWITVTNRAADDLTGLMSWIKPAMATAKHYGFGFTNDTVVFGSRYIAPAHGQRVIDLAQGNLLFSKGNLEEDFVNQVTLDANNRFSNQSTNKLVLAVSTPTGLLRGTVSDPFTGKSRPFSGVLLQKQAAGFGFLLGTNRSSQVVLFE